MVESSQHWNISLSTIACCILVGGNVSHAWSNTVVVGELTKRNPIDGIVVKAHSASSSSSTPLPLPSSSSALSYQNNNDNVHYEEQQPDQRSIRNKMNNKDSEFDTKLRLQRALKAAREADRTFGLCSPASNDAWKIVDDVYSASSASREVEDTIKRILGGEVSIWEQHF
jgi:hypothetical protein